MEITPKQGDRVDAADKRVVGFCRYLEAAILLTVVRKHQAVAAFLAEAARCVAGSIANVVRRERSYAQRFDDRIAELIDFLFGNAEPERRLHLGATECFSDLQPEREVAGGKNIRATPRAG